jgi:DNA-3-methyladenine glycosylase I
MTYCEYIKNIPRSEFNIHRDYHDNHYGYPIHSDDELFGRLILEIFQAGLNWTIILNKQENFRKAFDNFSIQKIAKYKDAKITKLLNDSGIIRNRLKIAATIHNARVALSLQKEHGSFESWLNEQDLNTREEWTKLFKKTFKFTGGEIVNEFLMSTGYLPNAHEEWCPAYKKILKLHPRWAKRQK